MDLVHRKKEDWFHRSKDNDSSVTQDEVISQLPRATRERLHRLFTQIEHEFAEVCSENTELKRKLAKAAISNTSTATTTTKRSSNHNNDSDAPLDHHHHKHDNHNSWNGAEALHKSSFKSKGGLSSSHLSQKLKTTYKTGTSKLVSSFKPTSNVICKVQQELLGHKDGVSDVCASPTDLCLVASASADQTAKLWNVTTGACVATYRSHTGSVNCVRFHPHNRLVLSASGDRTVHLWSYESAIASSVDDHHHHHHHHNDELHGGGGSNGVTSPTMTCASGDASLVTSSQPSPLVTSHHHNHQHHQQDGGIRDTLMRCSAHAAPVLCCDWLPDGIQFVTASWDRRACVVDSSTNQTVQTLTGHDMPLTYVSAHPTEKLVVTSSKDGTFRVCDFRQPSVHTVTVGQGHSQSVASAILTHDNKIVSSSDDRFIKVWDLKSMRTPLWTMRFDSAVNRVGVNASRDLIAIPHDNRQVRIFDMSGVRLARLPRNDRTSHRRVVTSACWLNGSHGNSGHASVLTCGWDRQIIQWSLQMPT